MTELAEKPPPKETDAQTVKPRLSFQSITFSNGDELSFDPDEIIVFVGPNNAGKSAALRELQEFVGHRQPRTVIKDVTLRRSGSAEDFRAYLEKNALKNGGLGQLHYGGIGYNIHYSHVAQFEQANIQQIASFFYARIATESRITESNAAPAIPLHQAPPSHPIHLLLMDTALADEISGLFRHAFGSDLIPFRAGGGAFPLYVGKKPRLRPGDDELSLSFVRQLQADAVPLDQQGDGMRSFSTVLLYVLASDHHSIQFLDEPEAFLHPPQARLIGEFIAKHRKSKSQLFIATHSTDVLDGLISGGAENIRIVRIQRDGSINHVKELSRAKTSAIAKDTLARYSRVFDGIFYQHVTICEADADCLFYSSILNSRVISGDRRADVLFIHTSGKHRMSQLAATLRELDVPVSVVADIDVLKEEGTLRRLFETLGGDWRHISTHFAAIKKAVEERRPPLNAEQVATMIKTQLDGIGGVGEFPKSVELGIGRVFNTVSPWDEIKRAGRSALPSGQAVNHFDQLAKKCGAVGLWILPVGELEGFCRSIGGHGPGFVAKVIEDRDLEIDPELKEARDFVSSIWARARPKATADAPIHNERVSPAWQHAH